MSLEPNLKKNLTLLIMLSVGLCFGLILERKHEVLSIPRALFDTEKSIPLLVSDSSHVIETNKFIKLTNPTPDNFKKWQFETRELILTLGESEIVPTGRNAVTYRVVSESQLENGVHQKLVVFESFDGTEIPAYLHTPSGAASRPGILVIPGHVKEGESGIEQLVNDDASYQHSAARQLAENGFVTVTPELRGFGYLGKPLNTEHVMVAYNAILHGTSYKWITLRDLGYAMELLLSMDRVDVERVGVTGASLGGELAVAYSALDSRVDAVAFHAFGGRRGAYGSPRGVKQSRLGKKSDQPHYCHLLPVIDRVVAQEHWYWMLAPRPVLGIRGSDDYPFTQDDAALYGRGWALNSAGRKLQLETATGGHEYFVSPAVEFFTATLGNQL